LRRARIVPNSRPERYADRSDRGRQPADAPKIDPGDDETPRSISKTIFRGSLSPEVDFKIDLRGSLSPEVDFKIDWLIRKSAGSI
jgi:hypothetical protein